MPRQLAAPAPRTPQVAPEAAAAAVWAATDGCSPSAVLLTPAQSPGPGARSRAQKLARLQATSQARLAHTSGSVRGLRQIPQIQPSAEVHVPDAVQAAGSQVQESPLHIPGRDLSGEALAQQATGGPEAGQQGLHEQPAWASQPLPPLLPPAGHEAAEAPQTPEAGGAHGMQTLVQPLEEGTQARQAPADPGRQAEELPGGVTWPADADRLAQESAGAPAELHHTLAEQPHCQEGASAARPPPAETAAGHEVALQDASSLPVQQQPEVAAIEQLIERAERLQLAMDQALGQGLHSR